MHAPLIFIDPECCSDFHSGDSPEAVSGSSLHMVRGMLSSSSSMRCSALLSPMERTSASSNTTLRLLYTPRGAGLYTNHAGDSEAQPTKTPFTRDRQVCGVETCQRGHRPDSRRPACVSNQLVYWSPRRKVHRRFRHYVHDCGHAPQRPSLEPNTI
jgi:hypothetical protein